MVSSGHDVVVGHEGQEVVEGQVILGHGVDVGNEGQGYRHIDHFRCRTDIYKKEVAST